MLNGQSVFRCRVIYPNTALPSLKLWTSHYCRFKAQVCLRDNTCIVSTSLYVIIARSSIFHTKEWSDVLSPLKIVLEGVQIRQPSFIVEVPLTLSQPSFNTSIKAYVILYCIRR